MLGLYRGLIPSLHRKEHATALLYAILEKLQLAATAQLGWAW
jgi:hypothetical protein